LDGQKYSFFLGEWWEGSDLLGAVWRSDFFSGWRRNPWTTRP